MSICIRARHQCSGAPAGPVCGENFNSKRGMHRNFHHHRDLLRRSETCQHLSTLSCFRRFSKRINAVTQLIENHTLTHNNTAVVSLPEGYRHIVTNSYTVFWILLDMLTVCIYVYMLVCVTDCIISCYSNKVVLGNHLSHDVVYKCITSTSNFVCTWSSITLPYNTIVCIVIERDAAIVVCIVDNMR